MSRPTSKHFVRHSSRSLQMRWPQGLLHSKEVIMLLMPKSSKTSNPPSKSKLAPAAATKKTSLLPIYLILMTHLNLDVKNQKAVFDNILFTTAATKLGAAAGTSDSEGLWKLAKELHTQANELHTAVKKNDDDAAKVLKHKAGATATEGLRGLAETLYKEADALATKVGSADGNAAQGLRDAVGQDEKNGLRQALAALGDARDDQLTTPVTEVRNQYNTVSGKFDAVKGQENNYTDDKEPLYKAVEAAWNAFNDVYKPEEILKNSSNDLQTTSPELTKDTVLELDATGTLSGGGVSGSPPVKLAGIIVVTSSDQQIDTPLTIGGIGKSSGVSGTLNLANDGTIHVSITSGSTTSNLTITQTAYNNLQKTTDTLKIGASKSTPRDPTNATGYAQTLSLNNETSFKKY
ncbi:uncharacterized protein TA21380 [Theileria annulata]|uniref:Uncharacterized protein n=1 Tax=Theileria annulata TaxID=5874 RepID=Q4UGN1_THEAN|nr:uncharacterized protein TA21380 [Theileria annulata]CAI73758.1 hypothetical protein TA21380 [Theileria annulata]|eukprot:XP_954435.1 hypothetical protein TA21380 [Theileria annulata]